MLSGVTANRPRRAQRERVQTALDLLREAAIDVLVEQGMVRATAQEIASRAGYSREMVRVRYGTKERLVQTILTGPVEDLLTADPPEAADGLDELAQRLDGARQLIQDQPRLIKAFLVVMFEAAGGAESVRPHMTTWAHRAIDSISGAVRKGQGDGSIAAGLDSERTARWIIRSIVGLSHEWLLGLDVDMQAEFADLIARVRTQLASTSAK